MSSGHCHPVFPAALRLFISLYPPPALSPAHVACSLLCLVVFFRCTLSCRPLLGPYSHQPRSCLHLMAHFRLLPAVARCPCLMCTWLLTRLSGVYLVYVRGSCACTDHSHLHASHLFTPHFRSCSFSAIACTRCSLLPCSMSALARCMSTLNLLPVFARTDCPLSPASGCLLSPTHSALVCSPMPVVHSHLDTLSLSPFSTVHVPLHTLPAPQLSTVV